MEYKIYLVPNGSRTVFFNGINNSKEPFADRNCRVWWTCDTEEEALAKFREFAKEEYDKENNSVANHDLEIAQEIVDNWMINGDVEKPMGEALKELGGDTNDNRNKILGCLSNLSEQLVAKYSDDELEEYKNEAVNMIIDELRKAFIEDRVRYRCIEWDEDLKWLHIAKCDDEGNILEIL